LDRISLWVIIAVILTIIAYTLPIAELLGRGLSPAICITPAGIKPFT